MVILVVRVRYRLELTEPCNVKVLSLCLSKIIFLYFGLCSSHNMSIQRGVLVAASAAILRQGRHLKRWTACRSTQLRIVKIRRWEQHKTNSVALVRERTIPTERPLPVGDVSANTVTGKLLLQS